MTTTMAHTTTDTIHKMVFDRWNASIKRCNELLHAISDETLNREIAPGKNRGIYLLGHLIAVHDEMLQLLDMGDKLYPELHEPFIKFPDKATKEIPSAADLRKCWARQCEVLEKKFSALQPAEWFEKHTAVSADDFAKEQHRNKLNIIVTRTTHLQYHLGQLVLLK